MHTFISCRLDYCNALLSGLPKKEHLESTITTKLSCTSADKDQRAGAYYTDLKVAELAPRAVQD